MLDAALFVLVGIPALLFYILLGVAIKKRRNKSEEWHEADGK